MYPACLVLVRRPRIAVYPVVLSVVWVLNMNRLDLNYSTKLHNLGCSEINIKHFAILLSGIG